MDIFSSLLKRKTQKELNDKLLTPSDIDNIVYIKTSLHNLYEEYSNNVEIPYSELNDIYVRYNHKYSELQHQTLCSNNIKSKIFDLEKLNNYYFKQFLNYSGDIDIIRTSILPESSLLHSIEKEYNLIQSKLDEVNSLIIECRKMINDLNNLDYSLSSNYPGKYKKEEET